MKVISLLLILAFLLDNPSEAQDQASFLELIKSDLESTKERLQQSIGQWPPGHYCILASGPCPDGFSRSEGYMRAIHQYTSTTDYITQATFGDSSIQCHEHCGNHQKWIGDLYIAACCK